MHEKLHVFLVLLLKYNSKELNIIMLRESSCSVDGVKVSSFGAVQKLLRLTVILLRFVPNLHYFALWCQLSRCQFCDEVFTISVQAWSCNQIDWMNFIVFLNAWNLYSHEVDGDSNRRGTWLLVNSILKKYILDNVGSMGPLESSPGCDLPKLVLLVTEPIAWHILVIQSCARSLVPSGKKKKKGGPAEHCNVQLSQQVQDSIQSVCETIEVVTKWLSQQISKPDDEKMESILSSLLKDGEEGPGKVYRVLETLTSPSTSDMDLGDRITRSLQCWSPADIARKIVGSQRTALSNFLRICDSKIKSLRELKAHL